MTINWETGQIDDEPHILRPEQRHDTVRDLEVGKTAYIDIDDVIADGAGKVWLYADTVAYPEERVEAESEERDFWRVIVMDEGIVLDCSGGEVTLADGETSKYTIRTETDDFFEQREYLPIIGVIENVEQREKFQNIAFVKCGLWLSESVLDLLTIEEVPEN